MTDKATLQKIRKCLALGRSANEHEAAAALAKARELMDAHGITDEHIAMADIEEASARASRTQRPPRWETMLCRTVCRALFVTAFINEDGDRTFVGRGASAEIASYAFAVLFRRLKAARAEYITTYLKRCKTARKRQRADIFCEGWASAVHAKIAALIPKAPDDAVIGRYLEERHPELAVVSTRKAEIKGGGATKDLARGLLAGRAVDLNAGVHGSGASPLPLSFAGAK